MSDVRISIDTGAIVSGMFSAGAVNTAAIGANAVTKAGLSTDLLQYQYTALTTAQILALNTTPITVVTAPGAGFAIIPVSVYATMTYNAAAYSANSAGFTIRYTNGSGQSTAMTLTQAFIQSSASALLYVNAGATAAVPVDNAALVIYADSANPTTGDSGIKLRVYYRVVPNPAAA